MLLQTTSGPEGEGSQQTCGGCKRAAVSARKAANGGITNPGVGFTLNEEQSMGTLHYLNRPFFPALPVEKPKAKLASRGRAGKLQFPGAAAALLDNGTCEAAGLLP